MKKRRRYFRLLHQTFKAAHVTAVFRVYLIYFILVALLLRWIEPGIERMSDSIWYCFAVATTVGFGDFTAVTVPGRTITIILSVYSLGVVALFTAVITGFFMDMVKGSARETAENFLDELEHLPELSEEELSELSQRVKKFRKKIE